MQKKNKKKKMKTKNKTTTQKTKTMATPKNDHKVIGLINTYSTNHCHEHGVDSTHHVFL
jgi:hypothetical protein